MLINMRNAMLSGGKRTPTAKDYVQDGLIAMWDGIENVGWGKHTSDKYSLRELVTGASISVIETLPEIAQVVVSSNAVDFTRSDLASPSKNGQAYLSCEIGGLASILGLGTTMTIELVAVPDTSYINTYASQRWGLSFNIGGGRLRRWFQGGGMAACFNKRLYHDLSFGVRNTTATMLTWQPKRHTALVASISSSTYSALDYVDGVRTSPRWSDFWQGATTDPTDLVDFGQQLYSDTIILPSRIYCWRIYSRALTADEIAANYAIDKARFNLPDAT